jgi:hypothetical protein
MLSNSIPYCNLKVPVPVLYQDTTTLNYDSNCSVRDYYGISIVLLRINQDEIKL